MYNESIENHKKLINMTTLTYTKSIIKLISMRSIYNIYKYIKSLNIDKYDYINFKD